MNKFKKTFAGVALAGAVAGGGLAATASPAAALPDFGEMCQFAGGQATTGTYATVCVINGIVLVEWNW